MNKQKKQFIAVAILMIICIVAYFLVGRFYKVQEEQESKKAEESAITAFEMPNYDEITAITYIAENTSITLVKDSDGTWHDAKDLEVNIDKDAVETDMLPLLASVQADDKIEKPEDASQYGFTVDDSGNITATTNTIVFIDSDNNTNTIYIGNENPYDTGKYYMMVEGDENIYLVDSDIETAFSKQVSEITEETTTEASTESEEAEETTGSDDSDSE